MIIVLEHREEAKILADIAYLQELNRIGIFQIAPHN
jgi:hypothetical protein